MKARHVRHVRHVLRLRLLRGGRGLGQDEMAEHLGIDVSGYCRIESGSREPTLEQAMSLAQFFDVPVARLLERVEVR